MNCGLMISVSFTKGAKEDALINCCHFLLTAKLSIAEAWRPGLEGGPRRQGYGSGADSVANICSKGGDQGIMVVPQPSISSELGQDNLGLSYERSCPRAEAEKLYVSFVQELHNVAQDLFKTGKLPGIFGAPFHGRHYMEVTQSDPFMHAFSHPPLFALPTRNVDRDACLRTR